MLANNPELFKKEAEGICRLIQEDGILFRPYSKPNLPYFSTLSLEEQTDILNDLKTYHRICKETVNASGSLRYTRIATEIALKEWGLEINPLHLEVVEDHHLVEFYSLNEKQIFRTFRFFETSSYTLEDIYCRKWYHIFERDPKDDEYMRNAVAEFFTDPSDIYAVNMPAHLIREKDTLERLVTKAQMLWFIPLRRNNNFAAIMTVVDAHYY